MTGSAGEMPALLALLDRAVEAISSALAEVEDRTLPGSRPGQYALDLAADDAVGRVLDGAGVGVLSEESGLRGEDHDVVVVVDPVDGSTNAARGLPWFAASLCAVDGDGPLAAVVVNLATGDRFEAFRGGGARRNRGVIEPSPCGSLSEALVGLSGAPPQMLGWRQFRALGAAALDLCSVAAGALDAYLDCSADAHGVWDYLAAALVCTEAGAHIADAHGRELCVLDPEARRTPIAAGTPPLLGALVSARATW